MRMQYKLLTALGLAMLAVSGAVAETTPAAAPATATPYGYMNPFDPNWWLLTFNNMIRLTTVPLAYATPGATAPAASGGAAAPSTTYPQGYLNPFDPNAWLAAAPTAAGPARAAAPAQGSPYVAMQTPYGPVYTFNYADPMAWNKLFAQPFAMPGQ